MKKILPVCLIVCLLLCACEKAPAEQTTGAPINTTAENVTTEQTTESDETTNATEQTTVPDTTEETEPAIIYRNPLNGEQVAAPYA